MASRQPELETDGISGHPFFVRDSIGQAVIMVEELEELRRDYVDGLVLLARRIRESWREIQAGKDAEFARARLRDMVHHLSGTGGAFGLPEITAAARRVQVLLPSPSKEFPPHGAGSHQVAAAEIPNRQLAAELRQLLATMGQAAKKQLVRSADQPHVALVGATVTERDKLADWCRQSGCQVSGFADSESFAAAAGDQRIDLLVLDTRGDNEGELLRWLHRFNSGRAGELPVLVIASHGDAFTRLRALRAGATVFLQDPTDCSVLRQQIHELLEIRPDQRPLVLFIDDEEMVTRLYQRVLGDAGFRVEVTNQPLEALAAVEREIPDVVVVDHRMPGCSGVEVARMLRQDPRYMHIPVIFVSADIERARHDALNVQGNRAGGMVGDTFLAKPLDESELIAWIGRHAARSRQLTRRLRPVSEHQAEPDSSEKTAQALRQKRFELQYQPVVDLDGNHSLFQALLRLRDSDGKLHLPEEFFSHIPRSLDKGYATLDRWVIEHVLDDMARLEGRAAQAWSVIIKLSSESKDLPSLLSFIANTLQNSHLRGSRRILFAIKERDILQAPQQMKAFLGRLHGLNVGVVIEGFTGHQQEAVMKVFDKPDYVRLDPSWNRRPDLSEALALLRAGLGGGQEAGKRIIASHMEDSETLKTFRDQGIRNVQGYLIQRPADEMQYELSNL